jgi:ATP-dependent helicase Lhr and Lhr-like helicase
MDETMASIPVDDTSTEVGKRVTGISSFLPPVRAWFEATFGAPTPPQVQGWPPIQRGEHTLILAPTGSGKTLAAFLWSIDQLFREMIEGQPPKGVRVIYISPLKALNNDINRNLRVPLAGIRDSAERLGLDYPEINVAVRSGDTPQRERQAMLRVPPQILITTPESLYLLLTSPKAREMFRTVRTVIVDEIHTLAGNKRGVHLSLSLERLQHVAEEPVQRVGLSATIQPLDEVARFLGGSEWGGEEEKGETNETGSASDEIRRLISRPVTVIDAAYRKKIDLRVVSAVEDFRNLPGDSVWPSIVVRILQLIREHKSTLVFANSRRMAERVADYLNEQIAAEAEGKASGMISEGVATGVGFFAPGALTHGSPIRVHHGSVSKEARLDLERQLKAGELPALVGTSSLELGIDIGAVDLIVQIQSPKSVAQGLQRVGRSGHLVGETSKGRIFPTHREDVIEAAVIAGGMLRGEVEPTYTPRQPLDVLAQQIVAMVSLQTWDRSELFDLLRCAYAYSDLTPRVFDATLQMLSGRYPSTSYRELRPRLAWDQVNGKLAALPGSRWMALTNGGTIPDTGAFGAYLADGKTKLGELDEEFVSETRVGDAVMLGSQVWRVIEMTDDRVMLTDAPGAVPRLPFWRGDYPWRPYELGQQVGAFRRVLSERLAELQSVLGLKEIGELRAKRTTPEVQALLAWLVEHHALDTASAWHTVEYLIGQIGKAGAISSDRTILVELFTDALGDPRMVVHSPFGGRVNGPWGLALAHALRERTGIEVEVQINDDGILFRLLESDADLPLDLVTAMGPVEGRERILQELPDSAVFGTRFRQNAARALLMPGVGRGKRTPFWLQRLRARDLLQIVRRFQDFPIVAETYRDCLQDVMDMPHLEEVLAGIQQGSIEVVVLEAHTPSPVAESLMWDFISIHMYDKDMPRAEQQLQMLAVNRDLLQDLLKDVALDELLRPEAVESVQAQLQHTAVHAHARTVEELAVLLQQMGDLSSKEVAQRTSVDPSNWIARLTGESRCVGLDIPVVTPGLGPRREFRWVAAEHVPDYVAAFGLSWGTRVQVDPDEARRRILLRFLEQSGPITFDAIRARYAFEEDWLRAELDRLIDERNLVHGRFTPASRAGETPDAGETGAPEAQYVDRRTLEQIHRRTLSILRSEVQPVPFTTYAAFLERWQHLTAKHRLSGSGALSRVLQQLRAVPVVGRTWERDVLPLRIADYQPGELAALCHEGELVWVGSGGVDPRYTRIRFLFRGEGSIYLEPPPEDMSEYSERAQTVYQFLRSEGAVFFADICEALDLDERAAESALIELVLDGLVTNDSLEAMYQLLEGGATATSATAADAEARKPAGAQKPYSSFEAELAQRRDDIGLSQPRFGHKPAQSRYRSAKQRVRQRVDREAKPRWVGRWTAVHRFGILGKELPLDERLARQARQLLARHGVVTHESLQDEMGSWEWGLIYQELRRLEMRGEVRRGYFVQDLPGVQFALPEVVERLRALRDEPGDLAEFVVMNACDPANLYGPTREGGPEIAEGVPLAFSRVPSTWLVQHRGLPVLVAGATGASMMVPITADQDLTRRALQALLEYLSRFESHLTVETWNGQPVLESPGVGLLEDVGFYRAYPGMTWERRLAH